MVSPPGALHHAHKHLLKRAKIVFNHHASVFDCVIAHRSRDGAELWLDSTFGVPDRFELRLEPGEGLVPCEVLTRTEDGLVVTFVSDDE